MKLSRFFLGAAFAGLLLAVSPDMIAEPAKAAPAPAAERKLVIVVTQTLIRPDANDDAYNEVARVFTDVFEMRKWPVKVEVERFAANTEDHELELDIFMKGMRRDLLNEYDFYAWVKFKDRGKTLDLGIVKGSYYSHPAQSMDEVLDGAVEAAAKQVADAIQPVLLRP